MRVRVIGPLLTAVAVAAVTAVTAPVPAGEEASRFGVVEVDGERVVSYAYKPERPASGVVTTEVFVFNTIEVLDALEQIAKECGDEGLQDLGNALLPQFADAGRIAVGDELRPG